MPRMRLRSLIHVVRYDRNFSISYSCHSELVEESLVLPVTIRSFGKLGMTGKYEDNSSTRVSLGVLFDVGDLNNWNIAY